MKDIEPLDFEHIKNPYGTKLTKEKEEALKVSKKETGWDKVMTILKGGWVFGQKKEGYGEYEV